MLSTMSQSSNLRASNNQQLRYPQPCVVTSTVKLPIQINTEFGGATTYGKFQIIHGSNYSSGSKLCGMRFYDGDKIKTAPIDNSAHRAMLNTVKDYGINQESGAKFLLISKLLDQDNLRNYHLYAHKAENKILSILDLINKNAEHAKTIINSSIGQEHIIYIYEWTGQKYLKIEVPVLQFISLIWWFNFYGKSWDSQFIECGGFDLCRNLNKSHELHEILKSNASQIEKDNNVLNLIEDIFTEVKSKFCNLSMPQHALVQREVFINSSIIGRESASNDIASVPHASSNQVPRIQSEVYLNSSYQSDFINEYSEERRDPAQNNNISELCNINPYGVSGYTTHTAPSSHLNYAHQPEPIHQSLEALGISGMRHPSNQMNVDNVSNLASSNGINRFGNL